MCRRIVVIIDVAILSTIISVSIWAQEVCPFALFTMAAESSPLTPVSSYACSLSSPWSPAGEDDNPSSVAVEIDTAASAPQSPFDLSESEDRPRVHQAHNISWSVVTVTSIRAHNMSVVTGAPGRPPTRRIKAYLLNGDQVALPGISPFGGIPCHWEIRQLLNTPGWIKILKQPFDDQIPVQGEHYELVEPPSWTPKTIVFQRTPPFDPILAVPLDLAGAYGTTSLQVLS